MQERITRVGVGVFIFKEGTFLMLKRQGAHGAGSWSIPGGHLEFNESFTETAIREVAEETSLTIKNVRFGAVTNDRFEADDKHFVTIWMLSDYDSGTATITEPDKCSDLQWHRFDKLPKNLFLPWKQLMASPFYSSIQRAAMTPIDNT